MYIMWKSEESEIIKENKSCFNNWQRQKKIFSHYLYHVKQMAITLETWLLNNP